MRSWLKMSILRSSTVSPLHHRSSITCTESHATLFVWRHTVDGHLVLISPRQLCRCAIHPLHGRPVISSMSTLTGEIVQDDSHFLIACLTPTDCHCAARVSLHFDFNLGSGCITLTQEGFHNYDIIVFTYFTLDELFCHRRRVDKQSDVSPSPCCLRLPLGFTYHCTISEHRHPSDVVASPSVVVLLAGSRMLCSVEPLVPSFRRIHIILSKIPETLTSLPLHSSCSSIQIHEHVGGSCFMSDYLWKLKHKIYKTPVKPPSWCM